MAAVDLSGERVNLGARAKPRRPRPASPKQLREERDRIALALLLAGGKTREQVAEILGITRRTLFNIERRAPERLRPPRPWLRPDNRTRAEGRAEAD